MNLKIGIFAPVLTSSTSVLSGGRGNRVGEPLWIDEDYPVEWHEKKVDLGELARLRWIEGWSRPQIAIHYGKSIEFVARGCRKIREINFNMIGLSTEEIRHMKGLKL